MLTWREAIRASLIELSVKEPSVALDSDETNDAVVRLRGMLHQWGLKGLLTPRTETTTHEFAESGTDWTIGPAEHSPDIAMNSLPEVIYSASYRRVGESRFWPIDEKTLEILDEYRDVQSHLPTFFVFERGHPLSLLRFNANVRRGDLFRVRSRGHFDSFGLDDLISLTVPDHYQEAVILGLASKLAESYGVRGESRNRINKAAREARMDLQKSNFDRSESKMDSGLRTASRYGMLGRRGGTVRGSIRR